MIKITAADENGLNEAAALLRSGAVVAFPTETVYGLGADIYNETACKNIFAVKNRPADKPLIVHISKKELIKTFAENISRKAEKLIDKFMPGPLTLVLRKSTKINNTISGGTDTVGIRMPNSEAALMFIEKCGSAIAGTSANLSALPAPCSAREVLTVGHLDGRIPLVLDGGDCTVGISSTVIDMTKEPPMILRQGAVSKEKIETVIGKIVTNPQEER